MIKHHFAEEEQAKGLFDADLEWYNSLLAKNGEDKCEVIYGCAYHTQRKGLTNEEKSCIYKLPVVHATGAGNYRRIVWARDNNGHFGIKKVIMGMASPKNGFLMLMANME